MVWPILLCVVFLASVIVFYQARQIAKDRDNLMLGIRIGCLVIAIACIFVAIFVNFELDWDLRGWF
ncbi:MAG: hypothetical protein FWE16_05720 [Firmicutes bacterium]|nr:hypothetical protein [Bacillota bacterium]